MRKAFIIAELLMFGSIPILFILPSPINVYVWFSIYISGILVNTEFWKHWTRKNKSVQNNPKEGK